MEGGVGDVGQIRSKARMSRPNATPLNTNNNRDLRSRHFSWSWEGFCLLAGWLQELCCCGGGGSGGGFFLARADLWNMFDQLSPACTFFLLFFGSGN